MQQAQQQGRFRPLPKQILNSGLVVICENIAEHKLTDEQQTEHIYYTWLETRYTQLEYMQVLETQVSQQWETIEFLLKQVNVIP